MCAWALAGSVSHYLLIRCNVYMYPRVTTEGAHSDLLADHRPHSLSRFHILHHMRGADKRGCVRLALAEAKHRCADTSRPRLASSETERQLRMLHGLTNLPGGICLISANFSDMCACRHVRGDRNSSGRPAGPLRVFCRVSARPRMTGEGRQEPRGSLGEPTFADMGSHK